ncbi:skin secretory protein xP2-like [Sorex araneus]|uniref:skin secretory protein xP2-like n=1 Tax=Sorex araneus TaxID=42254 RepID=UPI0024333FD5|nr:skin secretory protein xP2-like [Sorex araneus]
MRDGAERGPASRQPGCRGRQGRAAALTWAPSAAGAGAGAVGGGHGAQVCHPYGGGRAGRGAAGGSRAEGRGSRSAGRRVQKRRRGAARGGRAPGRARAPAAAFSPRRPPPPAPAPRSPAPSTARAERCLLFAGGGRSPGLGKPEPHPRPRAPSTAAAAAEPGSSGRSGRCPQRAPARVTAEAGRGACAGRAREGARAELGARSRGRRGGGRGRCAPPPVKGGAAPAEPGASSPSPSWAPGAGAGEAPVLPGPFALSPPLDPLDAVLCLGVGNVLPTVLSPPPNPLPGHGQPSANSQALAHPSHLHMSFSPFLSSNHSTDKKTKAQRGEGICPGPWPSSALHPRPTQHESSG